jgi:hypothetical protein
MPPPPSIAARLALIVEGVCRAVAARGHARGSAPPVAGPFVILIWGWLRRLAARFAAIAARAGRPARTPSAATTAAAARPRKPRLPEGVAWLLRLVPEASAQAAQLQHLLSDPALAPLLAAQPGLGRVLRPLCRALGVEPGPARLARSSPPAPPPRPDAADHDGPRPVLAPL